MKLLKKSLSILIVLILAFSNALPAFAAGVQTVGVTVSLNKTSVVAGDRVTLSFSFDQAVEDVSSFAFYVGYDDSVFTFDKEASKMPDEYYANCNQNQYTVSYQEQTPAEGIAKFGFAHISATAAAFDGSDDYAAGNFYNMVFVAKSDIAEETQSYFDLNSQGTAMMTYILEDGVLESISSEAVLSVNGVAAGTGGDANHIAVSVAPVPPVIGVQEVGVTAVIDKTSVNPGGQVTVSFAFDNAVQDVSSFAFYVAYDPDLFTYDIEASAMPDDYFANCNQSEAVAYTEQVYDEGVAKFGFTHLSAAEEAFDGSDDFAAGTFYNMVFTVNEGLALDSAAEALFGLNSPATAMLTYTLDGGTLVTTVNEAILTVNGAEAGTGGEANNKTVEVVPVIGVQEVGVTASVDKTSVNPGEKVTVSFAFDNEVQDVSSFAFYVGYDADLFEFDADSSEMPAGYYANCSHSDAVSYTEQTPSEGIVRFGFMHNSANEEIFDGSDDFAAGTFYNLVFTAKADLELESAAQGMFDLNAPGTAMLTYTLVNGEVVTLVNEALLTVNGTEAGTSGESNSVTVEIVPLPIQDITVILPSENYPVEYTVDGNVVTVTNEVPCKVGYLDESGKYVAIEAVPVEGEENTYTFTAPEGMTEVVLVIKGDANLDGKISLADSTFVKSYFNRAVTGTTMTPEEFFAGNVVDELEAEIKLSDSTRIKAVFNTRITHQVFTWELD